MQHLYRGRFVNFQSLNIAQFVINSKINSHRKTERNTVIFFYGPEYFCEISMIEIRLNLGITATVTSNSKPQIKNYIEK